MSFISGGFSNQTSEIFVPDKHYPAGWNLRVTGATHYTQTVDVTRQLLKLTITDKAKEITIEITPK
ncbi:MAG: hypothetical protein IPP60_00555 [Sphingobacteriales bacterium]|nr:hypothetical protein [Sphingobacteriales bacterium]